MQQTALDLQAVCEGRQGSRLGTLASTTWQWVKNKASPRSPKQFRMFRGKTWFCWKDTTIDKLWDKAGLRVLKQFARSVVCLCRFMLLAIACTILHQELMATCRFRLRLTIAGSQLTHSLGKQHAIQMCLALHGRHWEGLSMPHTIDHHVAKCYINIYQYRSKITYVYILYNIRTSKGPTYPWHLDLAEPFPAFPAFRPEEIARLTGEMDGHQEEASEIADRASALGEAGSNWEQLGADVSTRCGDV